MHSVSKTGFLGISHGWWVIICLIYTLSPVDLVPALLLGPIGIVDNVGVAAFGLFSFVRWIQAKSARSTVADGSVRSESATSRVVDVPGVSVPSSVRVRDDGLEPLGVRASGVFVVGVVDDQGREQVIEVPARNAEHAREIVKGFGGDGRVATVRLVRLGGPQVIV